MIWASAGDENRTRALSLGSLGFPAVVAALTCGGAVMEPWVHPWPVPAVPRGSPQDLAREWHAAVAPEPAGLWTFGPQPTNVSHDGECVYRSGARVPGHPPPGLSHAARDVRQSKPRWWKRGGEALDNDFVVPQHLGERLALGWCAAHLYLRRLCQRQPVTRDCTR
jgi:hypothetical protein